MLWAFRGGAPSSMFIGDAKDADMPGDASSDLIP
jgi:hypothetical protein